MSAAARLSAVDLGVRPWPEVAKVLGTVRRVVPVGLWGTSFVVDAGQRRVVIKPIAGDRDPREYLRVMLEVWRRPEPYCPEPLGIYLGNALHWHVAFAWVDGDGPVIDGRPALRVWPAALGLLARLRDDAVLTPWPLDRRWLALLGARLDDEPAATELLAWLHATPRRGTPTLAHGDFSLQNFVLGSDRSSSLVDWEEVGSAPPGFDAGWMLALARLGVDMGLAPAQMADAFCTAGVPPSNLLWFERLAVLRLLFRAKTLPLEASVRHPLLSVARAAVAEHVRRIP